jgi:hypothetical protein
MGEERLTGKARLRLVLLCGEIVSAAQQIEVVAGTIAAHLVRQFNKAQVHSAAGSLREGGFTSRLHVPLYSQGPPHCEPFLQPLAVRFPSARPIRCWLLRYSCTKAPFRYIKEGVTLP